MTVGELHQLPYFEAPLVAASIPSALGPVPAEVMALTVRRMRECGVTLTTAKLLADDSRASYSALFGTLAGLEMANRELMRRCRELQERLAQLEARS